MKWLTGGLLILIWTVLLTWFQLTRFCMLNQICILGPLIFVFDRIALFKLVFLPSALHVVIKSLVILFMKFFWFVRDETSLFLGLNHKTCLLARILWVNKVLGLIGRRWRCGEIPERGDLLKDYGDLLPQLTRCLHVLVQIILGNSFLWMYVLFQLELRINLATTLF